MRRICITGPEATGKSFLAQTMAKHYGCSWVPEYARSYLAKLKEPYQRSDLDEILSGQLSLEKSEVSNSNGPYLFCDTGPEVIWVWSQFKYGQVSPVINQSTEEHDYDLTLLMDVDLPWTHDPLRENPSLSERLLIFDHYRKLFDRIGRDYHIISGVDEARTLNAIRAVEGIR